LRGPEEVPDEWATPDQRVADVNVWWLNALAIVLGAVVLLAAAGLAGQSGLSDDAMLGLLATLWFGPAPLILWVGHRKATWPLWRNVLWLFVASPWVTGLGVILVIGFVLGGISNF
jgi:hypothetical protein